jgi:streptogramin lyase
MKQEINSSFIGIAADMNGNVYVADEGNHCIRKVSNTAVVSTLAGTTAPGYVNGVGANAHFYYPPGVAVDRNGNVFVADAGNNAIRKITPEGKVTTYAGGGTGAVDGPVPVASFRSPYGIAIDTSGNLYVTDLLNNKIRKICWK